MNPASPLIATGLRKSYGVNEVVCGVDLALQPGECFGLLGPNGAGKTTCYMIGWEHPKSWEPNHNPQQHGG